jgi:hypothetical protein
LFACWSWKGLHWYAKKATTDLQQARNLAAFGCSSL